MRIRPALARELPDVARLVNRAYRGDTARLGWTHEADLVGGQRTDGASLGRILDGDPVARVLVAVASDGIFAGSVLIEDGGGAVRTLGMLSVDPARQARGLGRRLLDAAEGEASRGGGRVVRIAVISCRTALIAWYERRGFRRVGEAPFPVSDPTVGAPKRDDLAFAVMERTVSPGRAEPAA